MVLIVSSSSYYQVWTEGLGLCATPYSILKTECQSLSGKEPTSDAEMPFTASTPACIPYWQGAHHLVGHYSLWVALLGGNPPGFSCSP